MILYTPKNKTFPLNRISVESAWKGLEAVIEDILDRFEIKRDKALEFGVWQGYSAVILSNFFKKVIGVDTFEGDVNSGKAELTYEEVKEILSPFLIQLFKKSYQDFIKENYMNAPFDLVHVDVVHTYDDTFACGDWAMKNATMVIFHDTESFPEVRRAVEDLSKKYNVEFYNYPYFFGLGILCHKSLS